MFPEKEFELRTKDRGEDKLEIQCFKANAVSYKIFLLEKILKSVDFPYARHPHSALTAI
jgi:hypothetical protein